MQFLHPLPVLTLSVTVAMIRAFGTRRAVLVFFKSVTESTGILIWNKINVLWRVPTRTYKSACSFTRSQPTNCDKPDLQHSSFKDFSTMSLIINISHRTGIVSDYYYLLTIFTSVFTRCQPRFLLMSSFPNPCWLLQDYRLSSPQICRTNQS